MLAAALSPPLALGSGDPPAIRYHGMYGGKAQLSVDNRKLLLEVGQTSSSGIKVLSVSRSELVVRHEGTSYLFKRGGRKGKPLSNVVKIPRDASRMFVTRGFINGATVEFMVDTGASHVVLSAEQARKLGLRYSRQRTVRVMTASRADTAYEITLPSVGVGGVFRNHVPALVTRGKFPKIALLGMSFLGDVQITQGADHLLITE
ncbi:MAG: TIGR02281 family clan AA aspartic protease [Myxococcota bacterium]